MLDKKLIARFQANQCSEEELQEIYSWLTNPAYSDEVSALLKYDWDNKTVPRDAGDTDYERIYSRVVSEIKKETPVYSMPASRQSAPYFAYAAAAVFLLAIVSFFILQNKQTLSASDTAYITKTNPAGQKLSLVLKDGSRVTLNAGSTLRYPNNMDEEGRTFYVQGEAFFEVAKDSLRPFRVIAGNVTVTALGTSFNVNNDTNRTKVSLLTGLVDVTVNDKQNSVILTPGQGVSYTEVKGLHEKGNFNEKEATAWKDGILYFNNASLLEIFGRLENWYGVEFKITGTESFKNKKFSGEFKDESLEHVLQALSFTEGLTYEIKEKSVFVQP